MPRSGTGRRSTTAARPPRAPADVAETARRQPPPPRARQPQGASSVGKFFIFVSYLVSKLLVFSKIVSYFLVSV
jgi:hypothetical protein